MAHLHKVAVGISLKTWLKFLVIMVLFTIIPFTIGGSSCSKSKKKSTAGSSAPTPVLPAQVTSPTPANGAPDIPLTQDISWASASGATSYDVYFDSFNPPTTLRTNTTNTTYEPGTLSYNTIYYWRIDSKNGDGTTTGIVWNFTTVTAIGSPPEQVTTPTPADGTPGVSINQDISWASASGATSYDVYFGTANPPTPSEFKINTTNLTYEPGTLSYNTPYYWRIDSRNDSGTTAGTVWSFTTVTAGGSLPAQVTTPTPADAAPGIALDQDLSWASASGATSYDVYFGTANPPTPSEFKTNTANLTYDPGTLLTNTTYYWRIDSKNDSGTTPGNVWSFSTITSGSLLWAQQKNPTSLIDGATAIAVDATGVYIGGYCTTATADWRIEKRSLTDGSLITTFGITGDGIITSTSATGEDKITAMAVDASGLYVVGYKCVGIQNNAWRIEKRNLTTGAVISEFNESGYVESNPSAGDDRATAIAIDATAMYVGGYATVGDNTQWRIEKRNLTTGALVTGEFGDTGGGILTSNPSSDNDAITAITTDADKAIYVVGYDSSPGDDQWRIEKRNIDTGVLIGSAATRNPNPGLEDRPTSVVLYSGKLYIAGYATATASNVKWHIENRSANDLSLVSTFNPFGSIPGILESDPSNLEDKATAITADSTGIYVVGYEPVILSPGNYQWRIEKRDLTTGALISSFGTDGVAQSNPAAYDDRPNAIAIDASGIYIAGYDGLSSTNTEWRIEKRAP